MTSVGRNIGLPTLDQLVGASLRTIRSEQDLSQDAIARQLRAVGLDWSRSVVASVEAGAKTLDVAELLLLSLALRRPPSSWFPGDGWVELRPGCHATASDLRRTFSGEDSWDTVPPVDLNGPGLQPPLTGWADAVSDGEGRMARYLRILPLLSQADLQRAKNAAKGEAEQRAAQRLQVEDPVEVALAAISLWDQSLTEERNERVARLVLPDTPPHMVRTLRGHATRALLAELAPVVRRADHAGDNGEDDC